MPTHPASDWFKEYEAAKSGKKKKAKGKTKAKSVPKDVSEANLAHATKLLKRAANKGAKKALADVPPWDDFPELKDGDVSSPIPSKFDIKNRKAVADDIKLKVARYYAKKGWGVNFELGVRKRGKLRADVFALAFKGYAVIVEVKSCVADFVTDYKAKGYLPYCNQFYFAFNHQTWAKLKDRVEFPPSVGVILIDHDKYTLTFEKKSKRRELDKDTLLELALRAAYRGAEFRSLTDIKNGGRFK